MQTTLFEWAEQKLTLKELADILGYHPDHLTRIKNGRYPITEKFKDRCVARLAPIVGLEKACSFFADGVRRLDVVSEKLTQLM